MGLLFATLIGIRYKLFRHKMSINNGKVFHRWICEGATLDQLQVNEQVIYKRQKTSIMRHDKLETVDSVQIYNSNNWRN